MSYRKETNILPHETIRTEAEKREQEMLKSFWQKAEEILQSPARFKKDKDVFRVGLEVETSVLNSNFQQATEVQRNHLIDRCEEFGDCELGAAQFEWRTDPVSLTDQGVSSLTRELSLRRAAAVLAARAEGVNTLFCGFNPFVSVPEIVRTDKEKYRQVPTYHNNHKPLGFDTIMGINEKVDVADAAVIALANSVQSNLESTDFADAVDKLNRSFAIGPFVNAACANARFLAGRDTGLADARMIAWEISHETRTDLERARGFATRIGLPNVYYQDMRDYLQRVSSYPFILYNPDHAFEIGIGLNWRDTRIKFIGNSLVVEFRPVSVQSSVEENLAAMFFYLGRLTWSCQNKEGLMPLDKVKFNRDQAMQYGLSGYLWSKIGSRFDLVPAASAVAEEIRLAKKGLKSRGFDEALPYLEILEQRVAKKETPSDRLASDFYRAIEAGTTRREALILALNESNCLK